MTPSLLLGLACHPSASSARPDSLPVTAPVVAAETCAAAALMIPADFTAALRRWLAAPATEEPSASQRRFVAACDNQKSSVQAAACTLLGLMHETGDGAARDIERAWIYYRQGQSAAGLGLNTCHLAAAASSSGISSGMASCCGVARACPKGCEEACGRTLRHLREGLASPLEEGCAMGRGPACFLLAELLSHGLHLPFVGEVVVQDLERTPILYDRACAAGVGRACGERAERWLPPYHDPASDDEVAEAEALSRKGCEAGSPTSCRLLGFAIDERAARAAEAPAPDLRQDLPLPADALSAFGRACELGMELVCQDLAWMHEDGVRVPIDPSRAKAFRILGSHRGRR